MRRISWIVVIAVVLSLTAQVSYAKSFSAEYTIQVYIPPVVGLNVPEEKTPDIVKGKKIAQNQQAGTFEETLVRDGQTVICRTTVLK